MKFVLVVSTFMVLSILGIQSAQAKSEFVIYGLIKESIAKLDIKKIDDGIKKNSEYSVIGSYPDIRLGVKGYGDANYGITYIYKFETDIDSIKKVQRDKDGVSLKTYAFEARNTYVGALHHTGAYVVGRVIDAPSEAVSFLDNWTAVGIDPFSAAAGYLPGIPIVGQDQGSPSMLMSSSKSMLGSSNNTIAYLSHPVNTKLRFGIRLTKDKVKGGGGFLGASKTGVNVKYTTEYLKIGFGFQDSKNSGTQIDKNGKVIDDGGSLTSLAAQYITDHASVGYMIVKGTRLGGDESISGNNIDVVYNIDNMKFHVGFGGFNTNKGVKSSSTGFEFIYSFAKNTEAYYALGQNSKTIDGVRAQGINIVNSFGMLHKF